MLQLIAVLLLLAVAARGTSGKSWADVKHCFNEVDRKCHEQCKGKLKAKVQGLVYACYQKHANSTFEIDEKCFRQHGFDIKEQVECWAASMPEPKPGRRRRRQESGEHVNPKTAEYEGCVDNCNDKLAEDLRNCNAGCTKAKPSQQAAMDACFTNDAVLRIHENNDVAFTACMAHAADVHR